MSECIHLCWLEAVGIPPKERLLIEKAAILHDIGKIGIRDSVLQKDGKLTDEEYKHIQEHIKITHNILNKIYMSSDFRIITEMACSHHENGMEQVITDIYKGKK